MRELWSAVWWSLVARERDLMRSLRSRCRHCARRLSGRHREAIFRSWSLGWNHLVGVMEARRDISRYAIKHALELVRVLRGGRGVKEGHGGIDGRVEGTIVMVRDIRGVGKPGIHVVWFAQPICRAKRSANCYRRDGPSTRHQEEPRHGHLR